MPPTGAEVEAASVDDDPADGGAVAPDELGGRMHDDVGAVLERPVQIRGGQGVVDDQGHVMLMGYRGDAGHIEDVASRIAYRLAIEGPRVRAHGGGPCVEVIGVVDE